MIKEVFIVEFVAVDLGIWRMLEYRGCRMFDYRGCWIIEDLRL